MTFKPSKISKELDDATTAITFAHRFFGFTSTAILIKDMKRLFTKTVELHEEEHSDSDITPFSMARALARSNALQEAVLSVIVATALEINQELVRDQDNRG